MYVSIFLGIYPVLTTTQQALDLLFQRKHAPGPGDLDGSVSD